MTLSRLTLPAVPLGQYPTPIEEMSRLRAALATTVGPVPKLLVKRDDAIGFGFGGNKVRKLRLVAADAVAHGADTLITSGGIQSNHARATAAAAARLGLRCVLVANGTPQQTPTANAMLARLYGAEVHHVVSREERAPAMERIAADLRAKGQHPYVIPIGASTPLGAAAFVDAIQELLTQIEPPDVIMHATSSGGTQAGLAAGCGLARIKTRVIGISADESADALAGEIRAIMGGLPDVIGVDRGDVERTAVEVDDAFIGDGYGIPTDASREAVDLCARTEALLIDHTYTAKAMAGLLARVRSGAFRDSETVLFWHTGGQVGLFA